MTILNFLLDFLSLGINFSLDHETSQLQNINKVGIK